MSQNELLGHYQEKKDRDIILIIIIFFGGWLGFDKFYYLKSFKKSWKLMFVKLIFNLALVGILWNLFDFIMAIVGKYKVDFRDYFE